MGTSKERVGTRADGTGPPAGVAVLLLALERIHAQGVALGLNGKAPGKGAGFDVGRVVAISVRSSLAGDL
jgi:hypothetical protein